MQGVMFGFLREFLIERFGGKSTWRELLKAHGMEYKVFFPMKEYPDEELIRLVGTAASAFGYTQQEMFELFGSYVGPKLLQLYAPQVKRATSTFEVAERTGICVHEMVHREENGGDPDLSIVTERESNDVLVVHYRSKRRLCAMIRGILHGFAAHYKELIEIAEAQCMLRGADECVIRVTRINALFRDRQRAG